MFHTIQFAAEFMARPEIGPKHRQRRALIRKGERLQAQVRPDAVETQRGPADLFFEDGTAACRVPFRCFAFGD